MANIVFITNVNECPFEIIEFVMLFTKYYIHFCKRSNNLPTIEVLKAKLENLKIKFTMIRMIQLLQIVYIICFC
jgi:hypothetical protein